MLNQPIAVFDSGVGGLSVLQALLAELPQEHFVFVADEAHLPYGDKPQSFLQARVLALAGQLHNLPAKALVLACNTATAAAVDAVRMAWPHWPVVGIEPALKPAFAHTRSGVVGVLATAHTIASPRFQNLLSLCPSGVQVLAVPCPGLVELIEAKDFNREAVLALLQPILEPLIQQQADVLVLGCTHYPFVRDCITQSVSACLAQLGNTMLTPVLVLEPSDPVARHTRARLQQSGLTGVSVVPPVHSRVQFLTTGNPDIFAQKLVRLLGSSWVNAKVQVLPEAIYSVGGTYPAAWSAPSPKK